MQGVFDDIGRYLNANIVSPPDGPILYAISTTKRFCRGRSVTTVKRVLDGYINGSIHWTTGKVEVCGKSAKRGGISRRYI
jgi:hypothetical protein